MLRKLSIYLIIFLLIFSSFSVNVFAEDQEEVNEYIIQFEQEIPLEYINQLGFELMYTYSSIDSVAVKGTSSQLNQLVNIIPVRIITENKPAQVTSTTISNTSPPISNQSQTHSWGYETINISPSVSNGLTGKGVRVAILDTGIDTEHPDLVVKGGTCVAKECPSGFDDNNGHGTHVAGIISAQDNQIGVLGIAPNVDLYAIKALDQNGDGSTATILAGVEWAIQNEMDIVNLSVTTKADDPALRSILQKASEQGILLIASSGNYGTQDTGTNTMMYPAKYPTVIAVGGVTEEMTRVRTSSTGEELELAAPGEDILSTFPADISIEGKDSMGYVLMTGTSMAAPFVTGILALQKESDPARTSDELRVLLQTTAKDLGVKGKDNQFGYGLVQGSNSPDKVDGNQVFVTSVANGKVEIEVVTSDAVESVSVLRGESQVTSLAETTFTDYVLPGQYVYTFEFSYANGSLVSIPVTANVTEPPFTDISMTQWFAPHLVYLHHEEMISGVTETKMEPDALITRAQAVAIIGRAVGLNGEKRDSVFSDVGKGNFASGYIQSAYENKILAGFPDGTFRPDQPVTRAEMAILIAKAYRLEDKTPYPYSDLSERVTGYEAINKIANANITVGYPDGTFKPYEPMTRATFAVFIARAENHFFKVE
ncbi:hypothetical protein GCM10008967_02740 [Bacillus carboniphilus]|uniref:SLH domain-containing protein n=1 Tax=Bacillus carboniphilus TaxID=86663 RepID=A0ABN0VSA7_9BACI